MTRLLIPAVALLLCAGPALPQSAGGYYKNEQWGYKVRVPDDFKEAALSASEEWIASKHTATRLLYAKRSEFYEADYPQMWVIGFPHNRQQERGAKVSKDDGTTKITFKNPYKDYKDFVKRERWFVGGGYYFAEEEEDTVHGMKVTKYVIKVEKMVSSPYRIVAWVYHGEDIDFAVQCKVLEDYYKKYRRAFDICLNSFRRIQRTEALPGTATTGKRVVEEVDESKLSPAELKKHRKEKFEKTLARETDALPDDWFIERSDHHVVMSNGSRKYAREVLQHADAIRNYLEDTFGKVGSDYVPPGIVRIFETSAELSAYHRSTTTNWFDWAEQVTVSEEHARGRKSWALEPISDGVTGQYLSYRNKLLHSNMPWWFRAGLERHMRFARTKGRRVEIKPDEYDREYIKKIIKDGKAVPIKDLFMKGDDERAYGYQCGSVISYLLTRGNRGKWRNMISKYMANLVVAIEEAQAEYEKAQGKFKADMESSMIDTGEETEDESGEGDEGERAWDALKKAMAERTKTIRQIAFERTFGHLKDRDWERLHRRWLSHAD